MKKLFLYIFLVLVWCNLVIAEEITDFELDGISIGDTLLKYMSKEEIMSNQKYSNEAYKNLGKQIFFEVYLDIPSNDLDYKSFFVKSNDKNFIIYAIYGSKNYENNINKCFVKLKELTNNYDKDFQSLEKKSEKLKILYDPSGKSYLKRTVYKFRNGDRIALECYDFDESFQKSHDYQNPDTFNISFNKKELYSWINP